MLAPRERATDTRRTTAMAAAPRPAWLTPTWPEKGWRPAAVADVNGTPAHLHARDASVALRRHFLSSPTGLVFRVWECSLKLAGMRSRRQLTVCVWNELERELPAAASMLRWDVPIALYGGGRMRRARGGATRWSIGTSAACWSSGWADLCA